MNNDNKPPQPPAPAGYWVPPPPPYHPGGPPPPEGAYPMYHPPQGNSPPPHGVAADAAPEDKATGTAEENAAGENAAVEMVDAPANPTNAADGQDSPDDPKSGEEKPATTDRENPANQMIHPMPPFPPYTAEHLHHLPSHMHPPHPFPGYPYPPHFPPPPPHPAFWGPLQTGPPLPRSSDRFQSDVDGREGATSPSQIQSTHRDEVQHTGCTCKKTRCLKLYCQCFGAKLYCGSNCRCTQCYNRKDHEQFRQEAMRLILSRNPSAFDSKFKKGQQQDRPEMKTLAHKVGCKCRKSGCMKKYCECYAANVKCSSSCRCMGCKNMGNTYYDPSSGPPEMKPYPDIPVYPVPHLHPGQVMHSAALAAAASRKTEPPIQAAHHLAFLKHGTPEKSGSDKENPDESVNSLMMAAYAMTEFGQGSSPTKSRKREAESPDKKEPAEEEKEDNSKGNGNRDDSKRAKI